MKFGHYELEGLLGRGTFGAVYAARDSAGARVAVKVMATRTEAVDRTEREGRLHALLGAEAGFVPLLESGEHAGQRYLVMPLLEGGTLRDKLARGAMPVPDAIALGLSLAAAIGRAHAQGVVHRDLKPENIIFTRDGAPLIADLGLAKHWDHAAPGASQSVSLTRSGELIGTAGYMAPEQIGTREASAAADVYALGAILYECLAGEPPFRAETIVELLARVTTGVFAPLRPRRPEAPRAFISAVESALSRDPLRRPSDGAALAAALGGAGSSLRRRSRAIAIAVGFTGTLLAAGVGAALRAKPATPDGAPASSASAPAAPPSPRVPLAPPPPVQPPPPPPPALDPLTAGFRATKTFKLVQVMGGYGGKHGYGVQDAAWLDDTRAVSVGIDHALRIWDLEPIDGAGRLRARERRSIVDHAERIVAVAVAPDGRRIVDASRDKTLRVYDPAVSPSIAELKGHEKAVVAVAYSPDGTRVVSGSEDGTARIWDVERAATLHTLACGSPVMSVAWSPVGERIVTGHGDGTTRFWSTDGTALPVLLPKLEAAVSRIAFSPDGRRILLGLGSGRVDLFDLTTLDQSIWSAHKKFVASAGFTRGGERIFTASGDTFDICFRLWDTATRKLLWTQRGHADGVVSVALSPDGRRLLTGSHDRSIGVHDVETGAPLLAIDGHASAIETVELSADGRTALTCSWDWTIRLWDLETGRERSRIEVTGPPTLARFSPDEKLVLIAHYEGDVRIHEVATGKRLRAVKPTSQPVFAMDVAPKSDWFATGGVDGKVRLHDIATGGEKRSLDLGGGAVLSVAIAADGQRVFAATRDGKVRAWDLAASSNPVSTFEFADAQGACLVALSSDPKRVLVGGRSGVNLSLPLEASTGRRIAKAHRAPVAAIVQGATSGRIFSASGDGNVVLRHGKSLDFLDAVSLSSSTDAPAALALSKDERTLLVGTNRGVLLRFEVAPE